MPTVTAMDKMGRTFKGILYCGIMMTKNGPTVLEYNARFGDPETQVILPRLKTDLLDIVDAIIDQRLDKISVEWDDNAAVCVVLASGGYPEKYTKGYKISGLDDVKGCIVFHAGTAFYGGDIVTAGGRVLNVVAVEKDIESAREKVYNELKRISFKDMYYRGDIAKIGE